QMKGLATSLGRFVQIGGSVQAEEVFETFKSSGARLSENHISRHDECHHGAGVWNTVESELASYSLRSLAHSLETKMALLAVRQDNRFHADSVVTYTQRKILPACERHFQFACRGILTRIANCFVSNPKDLVADDWVHLSGVTGHRKPDLRRFIE